MTISEAIASQGYDEPAKVEAARPDSRYVPETVWGYASGPDAEAVSGWCATREEAIAEGSAEIGLEAIYVYQGTVPDPATGVDADDVIERMSERADDNWPECAEDWPDVSVDARLELDALLSAWARKHAPCRFYVCNDGGERVETPEAEVKP